MTNSVSVLLVRAKSRSRRRRRSAGAAMFIVAVTLALLAVMGVYGLSATSADIRSAGQIRQSMQASHTAELGMNVAAEMYSSGNAAELVGKMQDRWINDLPGAQRCWSAKPRSAGTKYKKDEACLSFVEPALPLAFGSSWSGNTLSSPLLPPGRGIAPFVKIEVTNPVDMMAAGSTQVFTQLTVTIYVWIATPSGNPGEPQRPYDALFKARGFMTVPSMMKSPGSTG